MHSTRLLVILAFALAAAPPATCQGRKIDGRLHARATAFRTPGEALTGRDLIVAEMAPRVLAEGRERCALYVERPLAEAERERLAKLGVELDATYVPPVPGRHARGFHLASVPYSALPGLEAEAVVARLTSLEARGARHADVARQVVRVDEIHAGLGVPMGMGSGVRLAIADSGIDLTHPDFPVPVEAFDVTTGNDPASWSPVVANTISDHGTHVAGIAVGSGVLSGGAYRGMAPQADLLFYKIGNNTATEADIIEAMMRAVDANAQVFSMSFGAVTPFLDGSGALCQAADALSAAGVTCCFSAGNLADDGAHVSANVDAGVTTGAFGYTINAPVALSNGGLFRVVWRDGSPGDQNVELVLLNPALGDDVQELVSFADTSPRGTETRTWILETSLVAGESRTYQFALVNHAGTGVANAHVYGQFSLGSFDAPDPTGTVTAPALADTAIAVGSYTHRTTWTPAGLAPQTSGEVLGERSSFSSRGPRIDGLVKPDVLAPGSMVISTRDSVAFSSPFHAIDDDGIPGGPANYLVKQGTSMACPVVAGVATLLLEAEPGAGPLEVRNALVSTAVPVGVGDGAGLVDAVAALGVLTQGHPHPGTDGDFRMVGARNATPGLFGATALEVSAADLVHLSLRSPGGTHHGHPFLLGAQVFPTTGPAPGGVPAYLHLDPHAAVILVNGMVGPLFQVVLPGGTPLTLLVPEGASGNSVMLQSVVVPPIGNCEFSDGLELRIQ
jgi:subtilisin family serine protease